MPGAAIDLGAAVADLNQPSRVNTLSESDVVAAVNALRQALSS
jgi:hypothetical protein